LHQKKWVQNAFCSSQDIKYYMVKSQDKWGFVFFILFCTSGGAKIFFNLILVFVSIRQASPYTK